MKNKTKQPLTLEQIYLAFKSVCVDDSMPTFADFIQDKDLSNYVIPFVRALELAHGITGEYHEKVEVPTAAD